SRPGCRDDACAGLLSEWAAEPVQVASQAGVGRMAAVRQLHLEQILQLGTVLKLGGHVIVKNPYASSAFDSPIGLELHGQLARVDRSLGRQAALDAGQGFAAQLVELGLE